MYSRRGTDRGWSSDTLVAISYGATAFSIAVINNVWVTYNYPFFLNRVGAGPWFVLVQIIFGFWNALNDPLLGWLSDTSKQNMSQTWGRRVPHISKGGWMLALSFVFAWFPWGEGGHWLGALHFLISLCLYDGALTYVEVNYGSLLADISTSANLRAQCNFYSSLFSIVGSLSSFFAHIMWKEGKNLVSFRMFCIAIAVTSLIGFQLTAIVFRKFAKRAKIVDKSDGKAKAPMSVKVFCKQLSTHQNFGRFSFVRLLQVFSCTFEKNHLCLFLHVLAGKQLSSSTIGILISLSFLLPHMGVIALTPLIGRVGLYTLIHRLLVSKGALALFVTTIAWANGPGGLAVADPGWFVIVGFLCIARVMTECVCRLFPLVVAELVDEDRARQGRNFSMAASIVGTSALIAKPGESLAPILGWNVLGPGVDASDTQTAAIKTDPGSMLALLLLLPIITVLLQLAMWMRYTLHGAKLKKLKQDIAELDRDEEEASGPKWLKLTDLDI